MIFSGAEIPCFLIRTPTGNDSNNVVEEA